MIWHRLARTILAASVFGLCLAPVAAEARNDHRHGPSRHYQHGPRHSRGYNHAPRWNGYRGGYGYGYGGNHWQWGRSARWYWGPRYYGYRGCD